MKKSLFFSLLIAGLILGALPKTGAAAEQVFCPVMKGEKIKKRVYLDYQGRRIYFCCNVCQRKFQKRPEQYLKNLPS